MKVQLFTLITMVTSVVLAAAQGGYKFSRLDKDKAVLLIVDHQLGLMQLVRDIHPDVYKQNVLGHSELAKVFNLPVVMTTSAETGPNGPLPREILDAHPNAPLIKRNGEVNAWDNAEFREAVKATGRKQVILGGIVTDVCTAFLALSLIEEGYEVFANTEASGTMDQKLADDANDRMRAAGVQTMGLFAITMDLMRDWRNTPGSLELFPFLDKYLAMFSVLVRSHMAAVFNGTLMPGQDLIPH
ncbi:isochorismatase [Kalaharituber pfeilii]|nr:isochorismatase [Kalaharituber pfeilii]